MTRGCPLRALEKTRPLKLVVVSQAAFAGYALPSRGSIVLGRSESSDLRIDDPSITRKHARLHLGERIEIEDLGSVNGTRVRNQRLEPGQRVQLVRGEPFRLGTALLVIHAVDEEEASAAPISEDVATRRDDGTATGHMPASRARARVVHDPAMHALYALVDRIAAGNINLLIIGETGAGKELVAERLHERSRRHAKPFLRLNCAAVAESLLEAELFGYERGAFTGATQAKPGLLEAADGGTFFLDEVGEMPLSLQAKMLRALESQQVLRVGGLSPQGHRRALRGRHQPQPRGAGAPGALPGGPLLPPQRRDRGRPAACASAWERSSRSRRRSSAPRAKTSGGARSRSCGPRRS